jgi:alkanesulfonate monooxygenase SsuD/methylene tetrahydromethanopterin reductase-like flavin-dependent oxidoreductase (luciferase family)
VTAIGSGGRLTLGIGVGVRPDDFAATQRPLHTRGRDLDVTLEVLHRAWAGEPA